MWNVNDFEYNVNFILNKDADPDDDYDNYMDIWSYSSYVVSTTMSKYMFSSKKVSIVYNTVNG
jgi:hypothetical protein